MFHSKNENLKTILKLYILKMLHILLYSHIICFSFSEKYFRGLCMALLIGQLQTSAQNGCTTRGQRHYALPIFLSPQSDIHSHSNFPWREKKEVDGRSRVQQDITSWILLRPSAAFLSIKTDLTGSKGLGSGWGRLLYILMISRMLEVGSG